MIPYTIAGCRHFLVAVGAMHQAGFQLVRIQPYLADSAGGGRWMCRLVPAGLTETMPRQTMDLFPLFPSGKPGHLFAYPATPQQTAQSILDACPLLAQFCRGTDVAYALWYANMLQLTEPEGLVIESHYADASHPPSTNARRVIGERRGVETIPPPPMPDPSLVIRFAAEAARLAPS